MEVSWYFLNNLAYGGYYNENKKGNYICCSAYNHYICNDYVWEQRFR